MFKLFDKKTPNCIDLEAYDYSAFARDMTEEELLTVNGGKEMADTNEAAAGAEVGDTLFDYIGTATFDYPIDSYSNYSIKSDIDLVVNRFPWKMKIEHEVT